MGHDAQDTDMPSQFTTHQHTAECIGIIFLDKLVTIIDRNETPPKSLTPILLGIRELLLEINKEQTSD